MARAPAPHKQKDPGRHRNHDVRPTATRRRPWTTLLLLTGLGAVLALLLLLPGLLDAPAPGTAARALPDDMPDLGVPLGPAPEQVTRQPGFVDATARTKISFRHDFLEREQGYTFLANQYNHGSGLLVGDIDMDGWPDVYFINQMGLNGLWHNLGDGTFEDVTLWAGVGVGDRVCAGGAFGDVDGDGFPDLLVTSYRGGNLLFRNRGDGSFHDVTAASGLGGGIMHSGSATFFDADNDGDLDLYIVNVGKFTTDQQDPENKYYAGSGLGLYYGLEKGETDQFFRNTGQGVFVDESRRVGLEDTGWGGDVAADDLDGDGFVDLYVANMYGEDLLLMNQQGKRFRNETQQRTPATPYGAMGAAIADLDNDLDLDLFVADMHSDMWMDVDFPVRYIRAQVRYPTPFGMFDYNLSTDDLALLRSLPKNQRAVYGNGLLLNDGRGSFTEVGAEAGVESFWPWGAQPGDFDLDGDLDVFVPSGMGFPWEWWPHALLMNQGGAKFREEGVARGLDDVALGHHLKRYRLWNKPFARSVRAGALFDFDGDGDEDLVTNGYNCHATVWRNDFERAGRGWVQLQLRGVRSNRDAYGARVILDDGRGGRQLRTVQSAHGYVSQSSTVLTFGLPADAATITAEVSWPSGERQVLTLPGADRRYGITEGSAQVEPWQPGPVPRRARPEDPVVEVGWEPEQRFPSDLIPKLGRRIGMGAPRQP